MALDCDNTLREGSELSGQLTDLNYSNPSVITLENVKTPLLIGKYAQSYIAMKLFNFT